MGSSAIKNSISEMRRWINVDLVLDRNPVPSDYFGVLWALAGIKNALVLEHGATGTNFYNNTSFRVMNNQSPKGIIFSTGLDEDDVVMGREEKLFEAAGELDRAYHPDVISLVATAVTSVIGLDLHGIIQELQPRINAKLLAFPGGGFRGNYLQGIKEVFSVLADEVTEPAGRVPCSVNIIGPTIDSFNIPSDSAELIRLLFLLGIRVNTVFTYNTSVHEIAGLSSAALNIVTRDIALDTAERLQERFGTPYLYGLPFGLRGTVTWLEEISQLIGLPLPCREIAGELKKYGHTLAELASIWQQYTHLKVAISCPYDYALGLTRLIMREWEITVVLVSLPEVPENRDAKELFTGLGIKRVLIAPPVEELRTVMTEVNPHVIFGNSDDLQLVPEVPIRIHAAMPSYDCLTLFDGTPYVGFRGSLYLTQTLLNEISCHREVLLP
jgi:light-independent protochlorophyllide reductase B subunit